LRKLARKYDVGISRERLLRGKIPNPGRMVAGVVRYLRKERPDAVLTSMTPNNIVVLWARAISGLSTRVVIREAIHLSSEIDFDRRNFDDILPTLVAAWYPKADAVIAVSQGVADDLANRGAVETERILVIPNGYDIENIQAQAAQAVDDPWFAEGAPPLILAAGRLVDQKGFDVLLRAFAELHRHRPSLRLMILGQGEERSTLERQVEELGLGAAVRLPGALGDIFARMSKAAVFVLSSRHEGFPNVLVEAMAAGCPVVASDCPSGPREILDNGRFGPLVPVGDPQALAQAILNRLDAPRDTEALRGRATEFSLEITTRRYLEALIPSHPNAGAAPLRAGAGAQGPLGLFGASGDPPPQTETRNRVSAQEPGE
jgi:glycosyltransferase involved in cell wall biosynthesis